MEVGYRRELEKELILEDREVDILVRRIYLSNCVCKTFKSSFDHLIYPFALFDFASDETCIQIHRQLSFSWLQELPDTF